MRYHDCKTFFIGDPHIGHVGACKWRGFETVENMNAHLMERWNKVVRPKDKKLCSRRCVHQ